MKTTLWIIGLFCLGVILTDVPGANARRQRKATSETSVVAESPTGDADAVKAAAATEAGGDELAPVPTPTREQLLQLLKAKSRPLYRVYHPHVFDHMLTTAVAEVNGVVRHVGYGFEGSVGLVAASMDETTTLLCPSLTPLFRLYKNHDHVYTADAEERKRMVGEGFTDEGVTGYCVKDMGLCGALTPLQRFYHKGTNDHHHVTNPAEAAALATNGWEPQGTLCHVFDPIAIAVECQTPEPNPAPAPEK